MDSQKIYEAFPKKLRTDVQAVISVLPFERKMRQNGHEMSELSTLVHTDIQEVILDGERLLIPSRIYFNEPHSGEESTLNELQKAIVNCIYLRHHDGHVRQKRLNALNSKSYYFIVPYAFQLLGEYVVEIVNDLDSFIDNTNIQLFKRFISENFEYSALTRERMTSYWNEYYRFGSNVVFRNYIGSRIFERLENI